ncbi:glycerol-3-phosphate responsive antiterminator [Alkalihalobacillus sp. MEB130]|uniref:glycerol-3-phosphate responsive antiterminator n=1 Tax=Alkalihalobacillus sp. MEB130 TaxID=2976704 RepID=UPI0028DFA046|nr:glycerol-3-phosphate responsive antiterminator [Alkalihalobacillus sp. MEB130]MDT8862166.1 glycerol-3-phosphate responsive antiterminator [Alkalihalobacillus sp. MEB130]
MSRSIVDLVESQVIASIGNSNSESYSNLIETAVKSQSNIVFIMKGDLLSTGEHIRQFKEAGKSVFIHMDFIEGLSNNKGGVRFVSKEWEPDGIITTKNQVIPIAKQAGLLTIQRSFMIDYNAFDRTVAMHHSLRPDAIEVLPGIIPRVIHELTEKIELPIIAGGLIKEKEEIMEALSAGALATSVGDPSLWNIGI